MQSEFRTLSLNPEIVAADSLSGAGGAIQSDGMSTLECGAPNRAPAPDELVGEAAGVGHESLALAERELITAAKMEDIAYVEAGQSVVTPDPKTGNVWGAITLQASVVQ